MLNVFADEQPIREISRFCVSTIAKPSQLDLMSSQVDQGFSVTLTHFTAAGQNVIDEAYTIVFHATRLGDDELATSSSSVSMASFGKVSV